MEQPDGDAGNGGLGLKRGPETTITRPKPKRARVLTAPPPPGTPKPDYEAVRRWISQREAYEASASTVAPLTSAQRRFLAELATLDLGAVGPPPEPPVGLTDWVNIVQSRWALAPTLGRAGADLRLVCRDLIPKQGCRLETHFVEREPAKDRWACFCVFVEHTAEGTATITAFPCPDTGGVAGSQLGDADVGAALGRIRGMTGAVGVWTTFSRKRTARQFAASCAVKRLAEQGVLAMEGDEIIFARPNGN